MACPPESNMPPYETDITSESIPIRFNNAWANEEGDSPHLGTRQPLYILLCPCLGTVLFSRFLLNFVS